MNVFSRELHRMISRRIYGVVCLGLPLFSLIFMATIFGNGQMENLPIGVVDEDNSSTSRQIIRMVDATPELQIFRHYANEAEARKAVQKKEIYGYLLIPSKINSLCYYYHNAMLSVGSQLHATFETLLRQISVTPIVTEAEALGEGETIITSFLMPVAEKEFTTYNPNRNYAIYLSLPFFFVFLQVLLVLVTTYALGSESKFRTSDEWLQSANGNIGIAVIGKLLPYTFIFIAISILANVTFFGWMQIPLSGSLWFLNGVTILFICATQALALLLYAIFPALSIIISVVSMIGSLGATLSGVTFPVAYMDTPVYIVSFLFPIRHFMEVVQTQLYLNGSFPDVWQSLAILLVFIVLPVFLLPRLKHILTIHKYESIE